MRIRRGLVLVVMLSGVVSCKQDTAAGPPDAASAHPQEPKPPTVTRFVSEHYWLLQPQPDGGTASASAPLEPLSEVDVALPTDGGLHARLYQGNHLEGWVGVGVLLEKKPTRDESIAATIDALATGQSEAAEHHAWLAWAADRKDFSPLFLAQALELAHGPELSTPLSKALTGVEAPKAPPRFEALWPDAGEPAAGNVVYVAGLDVGLRPQGDAKAKVGTSLQVGAALDVVQAKGDWLEVSLHAEPVDAGAVAAAPLDAGTDDDAGVVAAAAPAAAPPTGWVEAAAVSVVPITKEALVAVGSPFALELAAAVDPSDGKLLARAIETSFKANRFARAIALSEQKPDLSYLTHVSLDLAWACRGKKNKAEGILDADNLPAKVPPNACIGPAKYSACVDCWQRLSSVNEDKRKTRESNRREQLRKRFPDGPFVKAELPSGAPSAQRGFFFEVPYDFNAMRCEEYELVSDPEKAVLSESVKLPGADQDSRIEWYEVKNDTAIYGFIVARSAEEARRALSAFTVRRGTDLAKLAPEPNVAADFDSCGDCGSCGD